MKQIIEVHTGVDRSTVDIEQSYLQFDVQFGSKAWNAEKYYLNYNGTHKWARDLPISLSSLSKSWCTTWAQRPSRSRVQASFHGSPKCIPTY
eukprot:8287925-Pyramimonas_sp.AAC.1